MSAVGELVALPAILTWQYRSPEAIARHQAAGIDAVARHAVTRVPFYRERYPHLVDRHGRILLSAFAVLTKDDLRAGGPDAFLADDVDPGDVAWNATSGTTGRRLVVAHDRAHVAHHNAACLRRFQATGRYRPWHRLLHYRPVGMPTRWYQRLGLFRRQLVLSSLPPEDQIRAALELRPHVIIGYPTTLRDLARRLDPGQRAALRRHLRLVLTESELLTGPHRQRLETAFGVPVFDEYSAYEVLNITFECPEQAAHVAEDRMVVEIVDDDGRPVPDGCEGAVVLTAFRERAMPLLRYAIGDTGRMVAGRCRCRRTFRRLQLTDGRRDHHVTLPGGTILTTGTFLYLAAELPGVAESMVRQDTSGRVTIHVVPEPGARFAAVADHYRRALDRLAGRPVEVDVVPADAVPLTAGGKGRFLESEYRESTGGR